MLKKQRKKRKNEDQNGFEEWGGYMNAKISKLEAQFDVDASGIKKNEKISNIFNGVCIFVNGYTEPSADELRCIMLQHGGVYHHYYRSGKTTHIIASALPNAKFDQMKTLKVVKCEWVTESVKAGRLLDYKKFLLLNDFSNISKKENLLMKYTKAEAAGSKQEVEIPKTAADEGYIDEFYNNSRLHYISSLGAMLKQYVQDMRESHQGEFPGRKRLLEKTDESHLNQDNYFEGNIIAHIDMDCFFVSVALRNYPHLKGQPVAVTHAKGNPTTHQRDTNRKFEYEAYKKRMKAKVRPENNDSNESSNDSFTEEWLQEKSSMSEIASCSYEARKAGVTKGMYLGVALKLCPNLKTVPYDFKGYKEVSLTLYNTVAEYTLDIEAISCDELIIDCTKLLSELRVHPLKFSEILREEIFQKTSCTSSVGLASNKLLARLATKHAKPNGQYYLTSDGVDSFMKELEVRDLPGVGRTINAKLKYLKVKTCGDLQTLSLNILKKELGEKTGGMLYKYCRGEDDRKVNYCHERKSVSAEMNYGIRFNDDEEAETFLKKLSEEVAKRLNDIKMIGKNITLKVMFRAKDAPVETAKFLGHGVCDHVTKSVALPVATSDSNLIAKHVISLYHQMGIPPNELRGIGIQITKLESIKRNPKTLQSYFEGESKKKPGPSSEILQGTANKNLGDQRKKTEKVVKLPTASEIDPEVLASLPPDIRVEIIKEYGLSNLMSEGTTSKNGNNNELHLTNKNHNVEPPENSQKFVEDILVSFPESKKTDNMNDEAIQKFLKLNLQQMRTLLKEWVNSEQNPREYDINMLELYLSRNVEERKLEDTSLIIYCLRRHIMKRQGNSLTWKITFNTIVDSVQTSMIGTFGKSLAIDYIE